jgi:hypothetical protein
VRAIRVDPGRLRLVGWALCGLAAGAAAGICAVAVASAVATGRSAATDEDPARIVDAGHLPPLLRLPGERVTLRFNVFCPAPGDDPFGGAPCDAGGEVFVRTGRAGPFRQLPLRRTDDVADGRYAAEVPAELAMSPEGFSYYAVLRNEATGASITVPSGGAAAPQLSLPLEDAVEVDLGTHAFGSTRGADARVASAIWGTAPGQVVLLRGPSFGPIGPSSFDVAPNGDVTVLDQANGRVERWRDGHLAAVVPVDVTGGIADMAVEADGSIDVLEPTGSGPTPELRRGGTPPVEDRDRGPDVVAAPRRSGRARGPAGTVRAVDAGPSRFGPARAGGAGARRPPRADARRRPRARRLPNRRLGGSRRRGRGRPHPARLADHERDAAR